MNIYIYKYTYIHKKGTLQYIRGGSELSSLLSPTNFPSAIFLSRFFNIFKSPLSSIEYLRNSQSINFHELFLFNKERAHLNRPKEFRDEEPLDNSGSPCVQTCIHIHYNVDYLILRNVTL